MFARSTTFHGRRENLDAGVRFVTDEVVPMVEAIEGCQGMSLMCDRMTGMCIATTSWADENTMIASSTQLRAMRDRGRDILGGSMEIDSWEVAAMHRPHHGTHCRASWLEGDITTMADIFKMGILPTLEDLDGFCGASMMVNPAAGLACATTSWEGHDTMQAARTTANSLRRRLAEESRGEVLDVHEFELAYAHLHVPELV